MIISEKQAAIHLNQTIFSDPIVYSVQQKLSQILVSQEGLQGILDYIQLTKGKMIRPLLVSTIFQLCQGGDTALLIDIATAIELIHMASLIHDDIVDESDLRRNNPTVHRRFGPPAAVLAGDFLFARAFALFTIHRLTDLLELMTTVISRMCEGEIQQLVAPGTEEAFYWQYIYNKTACLIESSCFAGAYISGGAGREKLAWAKDFGLKLGYAFQLVDDLLDYGAAKKQTGKKPGNDFNRGLWTLPIIRGVAQGVIPPDWAGKLSFSQARKALAAAGILAAISREAQDFCSQAQDTLLHFPDNPVRVRLQQMADFLSTRAY